MRHAQGYVTVSSPERTIERETIVCGHCQHIVMVKPGSASTVYLFPQLAGPDKEEPGAMCKVCMRAICLHCYDKNLCVVSERMIEAIEAHGQRERLLKAAGIG